MRPSGRVNLLHLVGYLLLVGLGAATAAAQEATGSNTATGSEAATGSQGAAGEQTVSVAQSELETRRCAGIGELEPSTAVLFVVMALFGGLLCYHVLAWVPFPYTALLMVRLCRLHLLPALTRLLCPPRPQSRLYLSRAPDIPSVCSACAPLI